MEKLALFFALTFVILATTSAVQVLDTPYSVSGIVWHDVNKNHIFDDAELGFPYVEVTLLAQTSSSLPVLNGAADLIEIGKALTRWDGSYSFSCLSPGYYAVRFYTPENRPSRFAQPNVGSDDTIDSDATQVNNRTAQTPLFLAESGGSAHIDLGLHQYVYINQFSLTGDQWVPSAPDTARGVIYAALNDEMDEMYYRIVRGDFPGQTEDVSAGFYQGWSNENGLLLRDLADRFSPKENVWLKIPAEVKSELFMGNVWLGIIGNGSFSSLARMRGQFYNFRNFRELSAQGSFSGRNVAPPVQTSAGGSIDVQYNLDRGLFSYRLSLSGIDASQIQQVGLYGPGAALITTLDPKKTSTNVSGIPNVDNYFAGGKLYVVVKTTQYPNGQIQANLVGTQPVVFNSVFNLTNVGPSRIAFGEAVFTLDWRKGELYYYVYIEGLYLDEMYTRLYNQRTNGFLVLDGPNCLSHENTVKQGYFFGIDQEFLNDLYEGKIIVTVDNVNGATELVGTLRNWF